MIIKLTLRTMALMLSLVLATACSDGGSSGSDDQNKVDPNNGSTNSGQDNNDQNLTGKCSSQGEKRCNGSKIQMCDGGIWSDIKDCDNEMMGGLICTENRTVFECVVPKKTEVLNDNINEGDIAKDGDRWWVNATSGGVEKASSQSWLYFKVNDSSDLEKVVITDKQAATNNQWHIAMKRNSIKLNGGCFGGGEVGLRVNSDVDFENISHYLDEGYSKESYLDEDLNVITNEVGHPSTLLSEWYDLDMKNMKLTPKNEVYIMSIGGDKYVKMKIESYYRKIIDPVIGEVTSSGWYSLKLKAIDKAVVRKRGFTTVNATAGGFSGSGSNPPAFYSFAEDKVVAGYPEDTGDPDFKPDSSVKWDLWLKRASIGLSAAGSAINLGKVEFNNIEGIPSAHPYHENSSLFISEVGFDPVLDKKGTYILTAADGDLSGLQKFMIIDAKSEPLFMGVKWTEISFKHKKLSDDGEVDLIEKVIELPEGKSVYYSFKNGIVEIAEEASSLLWDIKLTGGSFNVIEYNSGEKFAGKGVGAFVGPDMFDGIGEDELYWVHNSVDFPAFADWYRMPTMGNIQPAGDLYILKTSEGYPVAITFTGYRKKEEPGEGESGFISFKWKYL